MQIQAPLVDAPIGIGMFVRAQTDFIGPIPAGSWWEAHLLPVAGERDLATARLFSQSATVELVLGEFFNDQTSFTTVVQPQESSTPHGAAARLQVSLVNPSGIVEDTTTQNVRMDALTGLQWLQPSATLTGGYQASDRERDIKTNAAVLSSFPLTSVIGEVAEIALDAQFGCPPLPLLVPTATQLLTGSGTLDRPSGSAGVFAYGFTFRFEVVPPGLSVIDGRSLEFPERMAQFLVIRVDAGGFEYVADRYDFHHDQERICWGIPFPKRLEYSILPGVSLRFSWLLFPTGQ